MIIGIDLGTTYSAAAYVNNDGNAQIIENRDGHRTTPSVVLFEDGNVCVGEQAKENSVVDPLNVCQFVKRQMGNKDFTFIDNDDNKYSAEDISAMILKRIKEDCGDALGCEIEDAVITVPAYFDDSQRKATQDAGKIAGLNVKAIINEPTAAAIAFCHQQNIANRNVLVFDLGGGTFDVTIVHMGDNNNIDIVATSGHKNLGGFDFDNEIINKITEIYENETGKDLYDDDVLMQEVREKSESLKKQLSNRDKGKVSIVADGKPISFEITREEFSNMIKHHLNNAQSIMEIALDDAKMSWKDIDKVLLVGGSTRIPAVQDMIENVSGIKPSHEINPDEAVALGAAYYASTLDSGKAYKEKEFKVTDVNSHSLGVVARNHETGVLENNIIIPRNTKLPCSIDKEFYTIQDKQTGLDIQITEGEDIDLDYCTIVGDSHLSINPHPQGSPIKIIMQYDISGIIHVKVIDMIDNVDMGEFNINRKSNLNNDEINDKNKRLNETKVI